MLGDAGRHHAVRGRSGMHHRRRRTAGWFRRATSTRWSSASGSARPTAIACSQMGRAARAPRRALDLARRRRRAGGRRSRAERARPLPQPVFAGGERARREPADAARRCSIPRGVEAHVVLPAPGPQVPRYERWAPRVHFAPLALLRRDVSAAHRALSPSASRARRRRCAAIAAERRRRPHSHEHGGAARGRPGGPRRCACRTSCTIAATRSIDPSWSSTGSSRAGPRAADHVYCISERDGRGVSEARAPRRKVEVLYNPVDVAAFARRANARGGAGRAGRGRRDAADRDRRSASPAQGPGDVRARRGARRGARPRGALRDRGRRRGAGRAGVPPTARRARRASSGSTDRADVRGRAARHPGGHARRSMSSC